MILLHWCIGRFNADRKYVKQFNYLFTQEMNKFADKIQISSQLTTKHFSKETTTDVRKRTIVFVRFTHTQTRVCDSPECATCFQWETDPKQSISPRNTVYLRVCGSTTFKFKWKITRMTYGRLFYFYKLMTFSYKEWLKLIKYSQSKLTFDGFCDRRKLMVCIEVPPNVDETNVQQDV